MNKKLNISIVFVIFILFVSSCGVNERKINKQIQADSLKITKIDDSLSIIEQQIKENEKHKSQILNNIKAHNDSVKQKCIDFATGVSFVRLCSYFVVEKISKNPFKNNYLQSANKYIQTLDIEGLEFSNTDKDFYKKIDINWKTDFYSTEIDDYIKKTTDNGGLKSTHRNFIIPIKNIKINDVDKQEIPNVIVDGTTNLDFYKQLTFTKKDEFQSFLKDKITFYISDNYIDISDENTLNKISENFKNNIDNQLNESRDLLNKKKKLVSEKEKLQARIDKNKEKINKTNSNENKNKPWYGFFFVFILIAGGIAYLLVKRYYKKGNNSKRSTIRILEKQLDEISMKNIKYLDKIEMLNKIVENRKLEKSKTIIPTSSNEKELTIENGILKNKVEVLKDEIEQLQKDVVEYKNIATKYQADAGNSVENEKSIKKLNEINDVYKYNVENLEKKNLSLQKEISILKSNNKKEKIKPEKKEEKTSISSSKKDENKYFSDSKEEKIKTTPKSKFLYLSSFTTSSGLIYNEFTEDKKNAFLKIEYINKEKSKINFWIYKQSPNIIKAIKGFSVYLLPICELIGDYSSTATKIETVKAGVAELVEESEIWKCIIKAKIELK